MTRRIYPRGWGTLKETSSTHFIQSFPRDRHAAASTCRTSLDVPLNIPQAVIISIISRMISLDKSLMHSFCRSAGRNRRGRSERYWREHTGVFHIGKNVGAFAPGRMFRYRRCVLGRFPTYQSVWRVGIKMKLIPLIRFCFFFGFTLHIIKRTMELKNIYIFFYFYLSVQISRAHGSATGLGFGSV